MDYSIGNIDSLNFNNMYYGLYENTVPYNYNGSCYMPSFTSLPTQNTPQNLSALQQDTYQTVSAEQNIKQPKKSKFGKVLLWTLGLAGTAYAGVVAHRFATKPTIDKVAKNFSEIFRKDISKEEAEKMCQKYKEIFALKDDSEFQHKLFEQVKKDYGLENTKWGLHLEKLDKHIEGNFSLYDINIPYYKSNSGITFNQRYTKRRTKFFKLLIHELNHAKQYQIAYMTDAKSMIDATIIDDKAIKSLMDLKNKKLEEAGFISNIFEPTANEDIHSLIDTIRKNAIDNFGTTKANSLLKGSKDYELGLKYIENIKNYILPNKDHNGYIEQLLEKESLNVEKLMSNSYNYFANPWRILS